MIYKITSSIEIEAESYKDAEAILSKEQNEIQGDITDSLIKNAEVELNPEDIPF